MLQADAASGVVQKIDQDVGAGQQLAAAINEFGQALFDQLAEEVRTGLVMW